MIRPLRQRHRRIFFALGAFLPVALAISIVARKPVPEMIAIPAALAATPREFTVFEWERADLFLKSVIQVRLLRESAEVGRRAFAFVAAQDFVKPDLIVYWVAGNPVITDTLPDNARLLGAFNSPTPLAVSPVAGPGDGVLILYSLADQEIVEVSKPFALQKL